MMSQKQLRKPKYRNDIYYRHTPTRYAVALVDTDRFAATIDKVFQDGAEGAVRGMLIFFTVGVSSRADRDTALHSAS